MQPAQFRHPARLVLTSVAVALLVAACGPSVQSQIRDDYAQVDRNQVRRIEVVVAPVPAGDALQGKLWSLLARRYINQHRDFIVKAHGAAEQFVLAEHCAGQEGALRLDVKALPAGKDVAAQVQGQLLRCRDGEVVWSGKVKGKWASDEATVAELRAHYVAELGPEVEAMVAPAFYALRSLLETLPKPVLDEAGEMEKIELGE